MTKTNPLVNLILKAYRRGKAIMRIEKERGVSREEASKIFHDCAAGNKEIAKTKGKS